MRRCARPRLTFLILIGLPAAAGGQEVVPEEQYHLRVEYARWTSAVGGEFRKGSGDNIGTLIDVKDDLDVQDRTTFEVRGAIQLKRGQKLRGAYTRLDYDGDVTAAQRAFLFESTFYRKDSQVVTSLKGALYSAEYEFDFVKGRSGYLGGIVGARIFDVDAVLVAPNDRRRETGTLRLPIPVLGLATRVYLGRVSLGGDFAGLTLGKTGHLYEANGSGRLHLSDRLAVTAGYRLLKMHAEDGTDRADFQLDGARFGVEISL